jgi:hypothetical protein
LTASSDPTDLLATVLEAGAPPRVLARESGFALKLLCPVDAAVEPRPEPPGQGQVLVVLRGQASVSEHGGAEGRVVSTTRGGRTEALGVGELFRVANDARWSLAALEEGTLLLALSTSVPREVARKTDLVAAGRRRRHIGPLQVFSNEVVRVELVAARGRLPLRGWTPFMRETAAVEYFVTLSGTFEVSQRDQEGRSQGHALAAGGFLRVEPEASVRLRARGHGLALGLIVTGRSVLGAGRVRADAVRGFSPFG